MPCRCLSQTFHLAEVVIHSGKTWVDLSCRKCGQAVGRAEIKQAKATRKPAKKRPRT